MQVLFSVVGQQQVGSVSLGTYATLLAHVRFFPAESRDEVLRRLDFEPGAWVDFARRAEGQLARAVKHGESTADFDDVFGALRRKLKKRAPSVEDLPLDAEQPAGDSGPARSMRLRDLDPVQFLEILSARLPRIEVVPHGPDAAPVASPTVVKAPPLASPAPPSLVKPPAAAVDAAEARRRSQEAKQRFESTQVSPSVPPTAPDAPLNVTVQVAQWQFPREPSDLEIEIDVEVEFDAAAEPQPAGASNPHTLQIAQPTFPSKAPQLSLFEFANLCAEYNQCPAASREPVRRKYGLASEAERLAQLDTWRERLVMDTAQLAEWRKLYDAAMRHWHQIYQG